MLIVNNSCAPILTLSSKRFSKPSYQDDGKIITKDSINNEYVVYGHDFKEQVRFSALDYDAKFNLKQDDFSVIGDYVCSELGIRKILNSGRLERCIDGDKYEIEYIFKNKPGFFVGRNNSAESDNLFFFGPNGKKYGGAIEDFEKITESPDRGGRFILEGELSRLKNDGFGDTYLFDKNFKPILRGSQEIRIAPNGSLTAEKDAYSGTISFYGVGMQPFSFNAESFGFAYGDKLELAFPSTEDGEIDSGYFGLRNMTQNVSYVFDYTLRLKSGPIKGGIVGFPGKYMEIYKSKGANPLFTFEGKVFLKKARQFYPRFGLGTFGLSEDVVGKNRVTKIFSPEGKELDLSKIDTVTFNAESQNGKFIKKSKTGNREIYSSYDFFKEAEFNGEIVTLSEVSGSPFNKEPKKFLLPKNFENQIMNIDDVQKIGIEVKISDRGLDKNAGKKIKRKLKSI